MSTLINRRGFLKKLWQYSLGSACCLAANGPLGGGLCFAQSAEGSGKTLVLINLFGGIDGLNWIVPFNNSVYYQRRPTIAIPGDSLLSINSDLGFHPAWQALYQDIWLQNQMSIIQKVGYPESDRSHFASQDIWTMGRRSTSTDMRGWLGRLADLYFDSSYALMGVGMDFMNDFLTNRPEVRPTVLDSLQDFRILEHEWMSAENQLRRETVATLWSTDTSSNTMHSSAKNALKNIRPATQKLRQAADNYTSTISYPDTYFGQNLQDVARIIRGGIGTQIVYAGIGGWDHHAEQATDFSQRLTMVSQATAALIQDIKANGSWNDTAIVFFSEFGRNCFENDSQGTDHGYGNNMVVLGGAVKGGVYGEAPSTSDLKQEYLPYSIDFRAVFKAVVRDHLGLDPSPIFDEQIPSGDIELNIFT